MLGTPTSPQSLLANATSLNITGLTINTEYNVSVNASTGAGSGAVAVEIGQTDEDGKANRMKTALLYLLLNLPSPYSPSNGYRAYDQFRKRSQCERCSQCNY